MENEQHAKVRIDKGKLCKRMCWRINVQEIRKASYFGAAPDFDCQVRMANQAEDI